MTPEQSWRGNLGITPFERLITYVPITTFVSVFETVVKTGIKCEVSNISGGRMTGYMPFDFAKANRSIGLENSILIYGLRVFSFRSCGAFLKREYMCVDLKAL